MKKNKLFILLGLLIILAACSLDDITGDESVSEQPILEIYDTPQVFSNKVTRVEWTGVDGDNVNITYMYVVSTDTTLSTDENADNYVLNKLPLDSTYLEQVSETETVERSLWSTTTNKYANISFPFDNKNADHHSKINQEYTITVDDTLEFTESLVFVKSWFYLIAEDETGKMSAVKSKEFFRSNQLPEIAYFRSEKLDMRGFKIYNYKAKNPALLLEKETEFWKPIEFNWIGNDPDSEPGNIVELSYKYKLYETTGGSKELFYESAWIPNISKVQLDDELWNQNRRGDYRFELFVKDDAEKIGKDSIVATFSVFPPEFEKGILFLDDTDYDLTYNSATNTGKLGTPDSLSVATRYKSLFADLGYTESATDPLKKFDYKVITDIVEIYQDTVWTFTYNQGVIDTSYQVLDKKRYVSIDDITDYRMVIIASEDRSVQKGIDYNDFGNNLIQYLNVGGKLMFIGNSILLDGTELGESNFQEPKVMYFGEDDKGKLFKNYFSLNAYITGETYQKIVKNYGVYNYDFIGAKALFPGLKPLKLDYTKTEQFWAPDSPSVIEAAGLKENNSVYSGIAALMTNKAENFYGYKSIYDLPVYARNQHDDADSLVYEVVDSDTLVHDLNWVAKNPITGVVSAQGKVVQRTGSVGARHTGWGKDDEGNDVVLFKTAFLTMPLVFIDNSDNELSDLFEWLIDWYDLEIDPMAK